MRRVMVAVAAAVALAACVVWLALGSSPTATQAGHPGGDYPSRTIRIIVSAPPAGSPDIVSRILAEKLQHRWGQPVVVENRAGAGGNLGTELVAGAEPDGYTLLAAQPAPLTTNAIIYRKLSFDPAALEPVMLMTTLPNALVVRTTLPIDNVAALIAHAKANPGKLNYGSQGIGTTPHLTAELFAELTGTSLNHVPYRGTALAVNDLIAGHLDILFMQLDAVREHWRAGKLRMLAVATVSRIDGMNDVPTMDEAGVRGFRSETWNAIAAPPKTPKAIIEKLNVAMNDVLAMPEIRARLARMGMTPVGGTPADMAQYVKSETRRWGEVIRAAKITMN